MTRRPGQPPRQRSELDALNAQLERREHAARQCGYDPLLDLDDLAPARGIVWAALGITCVLIVLAMLLGGCGGGIDTADEFMGPPQDTTRVAPPRPCPVDVSACRSEPTPG